VDRIIDVPMPSRDHRDVGIRYLSIGAGGRAVLGTSVASSVPLTVHASGLVAVRDPK
jgi:hypothetical protein